MLFIRKDIPSKLLNADTSISGIENLLVEINLCSKKWLSQFFISNHVAKGLMIKMV